MGCIRRVSKTWDEVYLKVPIVFCLPFLPMLCLRESVFISAAEQCPVLRDWEQLRASGSRKRPKKSVSTAYIWSLTLPGTTFAAKMKWFSRSSRGPNRVYRKGWPIFGNERRVACLNFARSNADEAAHIR